MENFICREYGERLAILNTENIKICGWITKFEAIKMQLVCFFFHICRKFEFLVSQGSVATCLRWYAYCRIGFVANFTRFPAVQEFWKSVKIWQSYGQLKCGNFLRHSVECPAVTLTKRETHWNVLGCPKLANRCQPLVGQNLPYCEDNMGYIQE